MQTRDTGASTFERTGWGRGDLPPAPKVDAEGQALLMKGPVLTPEEMAAQMLRVRTGAGSAIIGGSGASEVVPLYTDSFGVRDRLAKAAAWNKPDWNKPVP